MVEPPRRLSGSGYREWEQVQEPGEDSHEQASSWRRFDGGEARKGVAGTRDGGGAPMVVSPDGGEPARQRDQYPEGYPRGFLTQWKGITPGSLARD